MLPQDPISEQVRALFRPKYASALSTRGRESSLRKSAQSKPYKDGCWRDEEEHAVILGIEEEEEHRGRDQRDRCRSRQ
ncbi:MAG TPA: hypothetical protein VGJ87_08445 [Roseiflexaceae bacterium]